MILELLCSRSVSLFLSLSISISVIHSLPSYMATLWCVSQKRDVVHYGMVPSMVDVTRWFLQRWLLGTKHGMPAVVRVETCSVFPVLVSCRTVNMIIHKHTINPSQCAGVQWGVWNVSRSAYFYRMTLGYGQKWFIIDLLHIRQCYNISNDIV